MTKFGAGRGSDTEGAGARTSRPTTQARDAAPGLGSAALGFEQLRVPRDEHEAFEMLLFWTRNTVEQIDKASADGWTAEGVLAYARGDLVRVLSFIDEMERP